jgi:hypothetical protein
MGGRHLEIGSHVSATKREYSIFRFSVRGSIARIVGTTQLILRTAYFTGDTAFVIRGNRIVLTDTTDNSRYGRAVQWQYPKGGVLRLNATAKFGSAYLDGVAVSVAAPSDGHRTGSR